MSVLMPPRVSPTCSIPATALLLFLPSKAPLRRGAEDRLNTGASSVYAPSPCATSCRALLPLPACQTPSLRPGVQDRPNTEASIMCAPSPLCNIVSCPSAAAPLYLKRSARSRSNTLGLLHAHSPPLCYIPHLSAAATLSDAFPEARRPSLSAAPTAICTLPPPPLHCLMPFCYCHPVRCLP